MMRAATFLPAKLTPDASGAFQVLTNFGPAMSTADIDTAAAAVTIETWDMGGFLRLAGCHGPVCKPRHRLNLQPPRA